MKIVKIKGRKKGKRGTRIQIYDESGKEKSYSMTIHGADTKTVYTWIKFFLKIIEMSKEKHIEIRIGG